MADNEKQLRVVFTGDATSVVAAMKGIQESAGATQTKLESVGASAEKLGSKMSAVGKSMTTYLTLPIVGLAAAATKMAMDFQQQMTYVRTDAGDTTDNIDQLSQSVLNLAHSSQFGPDELAKGLYHLASLGLRGADAMNALNTSQQMASVGGSNLEDTTSALGAAIVSGISGVQDYTQAAGAMDAIIGQGNMRMQDLVKALGSGILPVAKNAGLSLTDVGAALATLTDNGMAADESATRLRMTFALMEAPSQKAQDQLSAIGMTSTQMAMDMRTKGLIPALSDLKQHLLDTYGTTEEGKTKMAAALTEIFGGGRSSAAAQTLIDQLDRMQNKYNEIGKQSGEFADKVAAQQQTAAAKMKTAWSSIQADMITLGGDLLPAVANAIKGLTDDIDKLTHWWGSLSDSQKHFIEDTLMVTAVLGPATNILGKFVGTFGTLVKIGGGASNIIGKIFGLGGEAAGVGGLATGATEATGALSGLAAVLTGPVGLALVGTALAAGGAYLAYKHFTDMGVRPAIQPMSDFNRLAGQLGVSVTQVGSQVNLLTLAQVHQSDSQRIVNAATQQVKTATDAHTASLQRSRQAQDDVTKAQDGVKAAFDRFGQNSPQYQQAVQDLTSKQKTLDDRLYDELTNNLQVQNSEATLSSARKVLADATSDLTSFQRYLNDEMRGGIGVVARFGPTALAQVDGIDTLQLHIAGVVSAWNNANFQINSQSASLNAHLQGLGSTISRIQGQGSNLVGTLQNAGASLQGAGINLQATPHNAAGTNYWQGGATWVGEEGPEIVNLPRGAQVVPAGQSSAMASGGGGSGLTINVSVGTYAGSDSELRKFARDIYRVLQQEARANGFNGALPQIGVVPLG